MSLCGISGIWVVERSTQGRRARSVTMEAEPNPGVPWSARFGSLRSFSPPVPRQPMSVSNRRDHHPFPADEIGNMIGEDRTVHAPAATPPLSLHKNGCRRIDSQTSKTSQRNLQPSPASLDS